MANKDVRVAANMSRMRMASDSPTEKDVVASNMSRARVAPPVDSVEKNWIVQRISAFRAENVWSGSNPDLLQTPDGSSMPRESGLAVDEKASARGSVLRGHGSHESGLAVDERNPSSRHGSLLPPPTAPLAPLDEQKEYGVSPRVRKERLAQKAALLDMELSRQRKPNPLAQIPKQLIKSLTQLGFAAPCSKCGR